MKKIIKKVLKCVRIEGMLKQNRTEQNRTEQNRTEQNRTEQNRTEQTYSYAKITKGGYAV